MIVEAHRDERPIFQEVSEAYPLPIEYTGVINGTENSYTVDEIAASRARVKRVTAGVAIVAASSISMGVIGSTHQSTDISIGPLHAEAKLTFSSRVTAKGMVDTPAGPRPTSISNPIDVPIKIGELQLPSYLGVKVNILDKLPFEIAKDGGIELTDISPSELQAYGSLYASYRDDIKQAEERLRNTFLFYAGVGTAAVGAGWASTELLKRYRPLSMPLVRGTVRIGLVGALLASGCTPVVSAQAATYPSPNVGNYFGASSAADLTVEGILQTYIQDSANFRDTSVSGVKKALEGLKLVTNPDDEVLIQVIDGIKCSETGVSVSEAIADTLQPDIVAVVGDIALGGTDLVDEYCTSNLLERLNDHTVVYEEGGHDADLSDEYFKDLNMTHLNLGETAKIKDLVIAGADDPEQHLTLQQREEQMGDLDRQQVSNALADMAQMEGPFDVSLVNQPSMGQDLFKMGYPGLILTGGFENKLLRNYGPYGTSYEFQVASAGGAVYHDEGGLSTMGQFQNPGYNGLIVYSKKLRAPVRAYVVETGTDAASRLVYIPVSE